MPPSGLSVVLDLPSRPKTNLLGQMVTGQFIISVRITQMLMGGLVFASEASEKKISGPCWGAEKVKS